MPWPLPQPDVITARLAASFEAAFAGLVPGGIDARSPNALVANLARVQGTGTFDLYLYQQALAAGMFPDTATAADLPRHADLWGIPRIQATAASGPVVLNGVAGTLVLAGQPLTAGGAISFTTQASATLDGSGAAAVTVLASDPGAAGSLAAGTSLTPVTPLAGLVGATVDAGGLVGADIEPLESWRGRILVRLRSGPAFGQAGAYERWAGSVAGVAYAKEKPGWLGAGTVGVVVLMSGPRAPTTGELAAVQAALDASRPVTATAIAIAGSLQPVPLTIALNPDTVQTRNAVQTALGLFFASEAAIGGTLYPSRISEAVSSAAGEYSHSLLVPAAPVALGATALATPGSITWV